MVQPLTPQSVCLGKMLNSDRLLIVVPLVCECVYECVNFEMQCKALYNEINLPFSWQTLEVLEFLL